MTLVFNLLPLLITGVFLFWTYVRFKKDKSKVVLPLILLVMTLFLYFQVQPSYLPKGEIKRSAIPQFEQKELKVKDIQSKPMSGEERDERRNKAYKEPLPFIEKDVDNNK